MADTGPVADRLLCTGKPSKGAPLCLYKPKNRAKTQISSETAGVTDRIAIKATLSCHAVSLFLELGSKPHGEGSTRRR